MHHIDSNKKQDGNYTIMLRAILNKSPHELTTVQTLTTHLRNHPNKMNKTCGALLEKQKRTHKWRSSMDLYTWACQCLATRKNLFTSVVHTEDVVWKTNWNRWMIGRNGERESEKSLLSAWLNDCDDLYENERDRATVVRTRLLWCRTPAC